MGSGFSNELPVGGKTNEWYTPPEIFEALGLDFDLDPSSPVDGPMPWVPASKFYTAVDNGLVQQWHGRVWMNPPYGPDTGRWMKKLADHGNGVAFVFARTDTRWFHESGVLADVICFLSGRPHFYTAARQRSPYSAGAPSMLLAYGGECAEAVRNCGLGATLQPEHAEKQPEATLWEMAV